ncbi:glycosyltransferase family 4 protein [Nocardioides currus]|uniref:Glycosyltransferase n=1 Tax=Nocardioides currus TaxID=2133958 RepID=A0A2R7YYT5_9ACTN|nr:glycosyltransferase family 4 protein [Nocardioides currus]PUA81523.1 glycosyltransferase [Nocardioides currus]
MVLTQPIALWVVPVGNLAGVARHALDVARAGVPGWRLVFLTPPGELPAALREAGAAVLERPIGPDHGLRSSVATLRHAVRTLRPAVVHSHLAYADIVAATVRGPGLVTTEHGIARDDLVYHHSAGRSRLMNTVHTARLRRFDAAIAVSRATADAMVEKWHPHREVVVIPNGVDPVASVSRLAPLAPRPSTIRVLSLARFAPEKRLDALVDGFAELRRSHPGATLTLGGRGEGEAALRSQVTRLGLDDAVAFPGFVDPEQAMADHDVLAMLSVWENCSYALLDAAARGLGVVASRVGGNPEILPDRCLVDAVDARAVADALARQGLEVGARPGLGSWPTVADMTQRIGEVYDSVRSRG